MNFKKMFAKKKDVSVAIVQPEAQPVQMVKPVRKCLKSYEITTIIDALQVSENKIYNFFDTAVTECKEKNYFLTPQERIMTGLDFYLTMPSVVKQKLISNLITLEEAYGYINALVSTREHDLNHKTIFWSFVERFRWDCPENWGVCRISMHGDGSFLDQSDAFDRITRVLNDYAIYIHILLYHLCNWQEMAHNGECGKQGTIESFIKSMLKHGRALTYGNEFNPYTGFFLPPEDCSEALAELLRLPGDYADMEFANEVQYEKRYPSRFTERQLAQMLST